MALSLVFLLPEPELGGGTLVVLRLAELAANSGYEVYVSGLGPLPPTLATPEYPGTRLPTLEYPTLEYPGTSATAGSSVSTPERPASGYLGTPTSGSPGSSGPKDPGTHSSGTHPPAQSATAPEDSALIDPAPKYPAPKYPGTHSANVRASDPSRTDPSLNLSKLPYRYVDRTREPLPPSADLWVATFWTTVLEAQERKLSPVVHFCQGFEGEISHLAAAQEKIEEAYRVLVPTWTVSPRLAALLASRFSRPTWVLPPPLPGGLPLKPWHLLRPWAPRNPARVALFGAFEAEVKGVFLGLQALEQLQQRGLRVLLTRVSVLPLSEKERSLYLPHRYVSDIPPQEARSLLAQSDLLLFPVQKEEGFGLPLLEALALGVPVVATRTPTSEFIAGRVGAMLVDHTPEAIAGAAASLLLNPMLWRRQRFAGWLASRRFGARRASRLLQNAISWAIVNSRSSNP